MPACSFFAWLEDSLRLDGPVLGMSAIALMAVRHSPGCEGFAQLWMTNVGGLSMETLHGIARGEVIQASTGSQCYSFQILPVGKIYIP